MVTLTYAPTTLKRKLTVLLNNNKLQYTDLCKETDIPESILKEWVRPLGNIPKKYLTSLIEYLDSISNNYLTPDYTFELLTDKFNFWKGASKLLLYQSDELKQKLKDSCPEWLSYISYDGYSCFPYTARKIVKAICNGNYADSTEWDFLNLNLTVADSKMDTVHRRMEFETISDTEENSLIKLQFVNSFYGMYCYMRSSFRKENPSPFTSTYVYSLPEKLFSERSRADLLDWISRTSGKLMNTMQLRWFNATFDKLTVAEKSAFLRTCGLRVTHPLSNLCFRLVDSSFWEVYYNRLKQFVYEPQ